MNNDNQYYYNLLKTKNTCKNLAAIITFIYNYILIISIVLFSSTFGLFFIVGGEKELVENIFYNGIISIFVCTTTLVLYIISNSNFKKRKYDSKMDYLSSICILGTIISSRFLLDMPIILLCVLVLLSCVDLYNIYDINKKIRANNINMKTPYIFSNTITKYSNYICPICNTVNDGNSNYCFNCGNRIQKQN